MKIMKRNQILYSIVVLSFIVFDVILLIDRANLKRNSSQSFGNYYNFDNDYLNERLNDNIRISEPSSLLSIDGDSLIGNSYRSKRRIIFRYTISSCRDCVTSEFDVIQQVIRENPLLGKNLFILTYYHNNSAMAGDLHELRKRKVNVPIFISKYLNGVPLEEENLPYYFVLENDSIIRNVFICHHDKPNRTEAYLRSAIEFCK